MSGIFASTLGMKSLPAITKSSDIFRERDAYQRALLFINDRDVRHTTIQNLQQYLIYNFIILMASR